ncbi:hypothetical protein D9M71_817890 [compost metagenome]
MGPIAQATTGLKAITPTQVLILPTVEVELVAHDQTGAAAFGLMVIKRRLIIAFGVFREDRHQGVFQAVVHRQ